MIIKTLKKSLHPVLVGLLMALTSQAFMSPSWADEASRTIIKSKAPEYPRAAERRGIEGFVVLEYTVTAAGEVNSPVVVESTPEGVFDHAAIKAVADWKYETASTDTPGMQVKIKFTQ